MKVGPSPEWLQRRLRSIGLSPINNVVDVTNFVLHELGQPLHAFDAAAITGGHIRVKRAEAGEHFVTLDNVARTLSADDLVIADTNGEPLALAGVFGGKTSGVGPGTTRVFLESAYFAPAVVRRTSQAHGLKTDASFRFERGTDPYMVPLALQAAPPCYCRKWPGRASPRRSWMSFRTPSPTAKCACAWPAWPSSSARKSARRKIREILTNLDIKIEKKVPLKTQLITTWTLQVPPYWVDVTREADVIEEILRIYGFNNVALTAPQFGFVPIALPQPRPRGGAPESGQPAQRPGLFGDYHQLAHQLAVL